jgi:hypothetical protein
MINRDSNERFPRGLMLLDEILKSKLKSHYDRQLVGQSALVSGAHLGPATNFSISLRFSFRLLLFVML